MTAVNVVDRRIPQVRRGRSARRILVPALGILAVLAYWELHIRVFNVPTYLVPAPSLVAETFVDEWPTLQRNVGATMIEAAGGFLIGNGIAILLAILFVHNKTMEASALELMRVLSATRAQTFFKLRLPSSLPFLFAALKISSASSVIGAIVAEWIGADVGLGYLIIVSTFEFRTGLLYATTVMASFLALGLFLAIVVLERLIIRWQPDTPKQ